MQSADRDLIALAVAGDRAAFGALYAQYAPMVRAFVRSRSRGMASDEDICQDVFVRALASIGAYTDYGARLSTWLCEIARCRIIDVARAKRRRPPQVSIRETDYQLVDSDAAICARLDAAQLVGPALRALPPRWQLILYLRFDRCLDVGATAKALQHRALTRLREILEEDL